MSEAVGTLYEMAAGLDPLTTYELPSSNSVTLAAQALVAAEIPALWDATLPDGAMAVKALPKGRAATLSKDGSLSLLSGDGKIAWQKPLAGGESWALDVSADGEVIAAGASLRVAAFNSQGKQLFDELVMEGKDARTVTCVAVSGDGSLVAAGADDGRLTLFTSKGKRLWTVGGVDPNDPKAVARPYLSSIFSADGKSLVALTAGEAHAIDTKDGKTLAKVAGVNGTVAPVRTADGLLVTDGRTRVALLSAAEGKLVKETAMPVDGTVAMAATPAGVVVGSGPDNTVRMLKALEGKAQDNTVWAHTQRGFVVKQLAASGDLIAVSYWGGRLAVLDAAGKIVATRQFEQDITALAWLDGKLVVASADGRLTAVEAKAR
jgi:WD40 repeat protein